LSSNSDTAHSGPQVQVAKVAAVPSHEHKVIVKLVELRRLRAVWASSSQNVDLRLVQCSQIVRRRRRREFNQRC